MGITKFLKSSELEEIADDNYKLDENDKMNSSKVESRCWESNLGPLEAKTLPHAHELASYIASSKCTVHIHQPFSRTILVLFSRPFLYLATFECNTTSDWLNHMV